MAIVKVDIDSLITLNKQLQQQLDRYCLKMRDVFLLQNALSSCWDEQQAGSFKDFMDTIKGSKLDVEDCVIHIRDKISEIIEIAEKYNSTKNFTFRG